MAKKLVIVESPAKAKTIKNFLGAEYTVLASIGHIRDLAENKSDLPKEVQKSWWADYSVNVDNNFEPIYLVPKGKLEQVRKLKAALAEADTLVLATDEDREGESISWHLLEVLKPKKGVTVQRIAFHEITRDAILSALKSPRAVDQDLVRAQETRRILDRLYGYTLSPVLWRMGRGRGLSAGRVQSPAVKLIVERELERKRFRNAEYWDLAAQLKADGGELGATLVEVSGQKLASGKDDFDSATGQLKDPKRRWLKEDDARPLAERALAAKPWTVSDVQQKPEQRRPYPPFMTSTLQQEANRKLGFGADRTMRIAQDLYEGMDGSGFEGGLITYMRTDSVNLSTLAVDQARTLIASRYGAAYLPAKPNRYTSKVNNAQEAHEAIRPTDVNRTPEAVAKALGARGSDHARLYELIWKRTVASQMKPADLSITSVRIQTETAQRENLVFSTSGKSIVFPGFLRAYVEGSDDPEAALEDQEKILPPLKPGQTLTALKVEALGHTTKPPARYTDASLVKALEERGIGRPSTYAAILKTIVDREYVRKAGKELVPTFMAFLVTEVLDQNFSEFTDLGFTAEMDRDLDEIANGKEDWKKYLHRFFLGAGKDHPGLKPLVDERLGNIRRPVLEVGEDAGEPIVVQFGRNGFFLVRGTLDEGGQTASVPDDLAPADLTVEKALALFEAKSAGPETAGIDPVTGRQLLIRNKGGYYLEAERTPEEIESKVKPRWVSVPPGVNPKDLSQEEIEWLCTMPLDLGEGIVAKMGKYGAYVEQGTERRTVENWRDLMTMDTAGAAALLAAPKVMRGRTARAPASALKEFGELEGCAGPVKVLSGRFGPYVTDGTTNATLPRNLQPEDVTESIAIELLEAKRAAGPAPKRGRKAPARKAPAKKPAAKKSTAASKKKKA
jgi:DNA topoisomerase I